MKQKWEDVSSYSRGQDRVPNTWEIRFKDGVRIALHRLYGAEGWFVSCSSLCIERKPLKAVDADLAKTEAILFVYRTVSRYQKQVETLIAATDGRGQKQ